MTPNRTLAVATALLLAAAALAAAGEVPGSKTLDRILDRIEVLPGREHRAIAFFPLALEPAEEDGEDAPDAAAGGDGEGEPAAAAGEDAGGEDGDAAAKGPVLADLAAAEGSIRFREPRLPARRWNVEAVSEADRPVLLVGGSLLVGGRLDRMVPADYLLPPGETVEIETLPAEYRRDLRALEEDDEDARRLRLSAFRAPVFLRKHAVFDADRDLVPTFVSHFLGYRAEDDTRHSLQAISESPHLAGRIQPYLVAFADVPDLADARVVGWVAIVAGRIHDVEIFGSNDLARACFPAHLRAHAFPATALARRADDFDVEMPEPDEDESVERFRDEVDGFLAMLRESERRGGRKPMGTLGHSCVLREDRVWGEAVVLDGRLVHAGAVADLPLHDRLYRKPLPPPPGEEDIPAIGELERGGEGDGRRLTEFEKRLLDRMRERRDR